MAQRKTTAPDDGKTQRQRFIEAAREFGADADQDTLRRVVRTVATVKPKAAKKAARKLGRKK